MRGGFKQAGQQAVDSRSCGFQRAVGAGVEVEWRREEEGGRRGVVAKALEGPGLWIEVTRGGASGAAIECAARTLDSAMVATHAVRGLTNEVMRRLQELDERLPDELGVNPKAQTLDP